MLTTHHQQIKLSVLTLNAWMFKAAHLAPEGGQFFLETLHLSAGAMDFIFVRTGKWPGYCTRGPERSVAFRLFGFLPSSNEIEGLVWVWHICRSEPARLEDAGWLLAGRQLQAPHLCQSSLKWACSRKSHDEGYLFVRSPMCGIMRSQNSGNVAHRLQISCPCGNGLFTGSVAYSPIDRRTLQMSRKNW